jgi:hypothetical protein
MVSYFEVTAEWRKLHNGELHNFYSSQNVIRQIKSRMRWVGHVACMGEERKCTRFWWEDPKEAHSEDLGIDGRMGSKWILGRLAGRVWSGVTWLRVGTGGGLL